MLRRVEDHAPLVARRRSIPSWLAEGAFIIISVLLGFAVAQYGESRADAELKRRALASLQAELEHNLAATEPYVDFHQAYHEALAKVDAAATRESGYQVYIRVRPRQAGQQTDVPILRSAAWDAATMSGALRLIDYDLIAGFSEIYQMQDHLGDAIDRIPVSTPAFFDPAMGAASVRLSHAAIGELWWGEKTLVELYRKQLDALRASAGR
jgi:hypothetical protein